MREELLDPTALSEEEDLEIVNDDHGLRPRTLDEFVGQAEHLVEAVQALCSSTPDDHMKPLSVELAALDKKAHQVEMTGGVLLTLEGLTPLTQEQFEALTQGKFKPPENPGA